MLDYIILFLAWITFFFLHSLLASRGSKATFIQPGYLSKQQYRLIYSLISSLGLIAVLSIQLYLSSKTLIEPTPWLQFGGLVIATFGILILKRSFQFISIKGFLGIKEEESHELIVKGLHAKVRHPIYLGTILLILGAVCFVPTDLMVISALANFCYLPIGILLEEDKLVKQYGTDYLTYRKRTPSVFPKRGSIF